jgi:hypothetical protein
MDACSLASFAEKPVHARVIFRVTSCAFINLPMVKRVLLAALENSDVLVKPL